MPFTLSHPAIVLPLYFYRKRWFSITGLIIGSMVPDIKFFTSHSIIRYYSHSLLGAIWLDMPLTILLCFLFHNIVCKPLVYNLPESLRNRFYNKEPFNWNKHFINDWAIILTSILIGIYSHLIWDRITHLSPYFISRLPGLKNSRILKIEPMLFYRTIRSTYSLAGLIAEAFMIWKLPVVITRRPINNIGIYWSATFGLSILIYLYLIQNKQLFIEDFIGLALESIFIAVFLISLIYRAFFKGNKIIR